MYYYLHLYKCKNWGTEEWKNLPMAIQLINAWLRNQAQIFEAKFSALDGTS